jgi:hypothetical protein
MQLDPGCIISSIETLRSFYFAYFHSLMKYGIIFWGNLSDTKKVFTLQEKIVKTRDGCQFL